MLAALARRLLLLAVARMLLLSFAVAADPPADAQPGGKTATNYALPDGGVQELIPFVIKLRSEDTPDADYGKKIAAIVAAGRKLHEQAGEADRKLAGYDQAIGIWLYVAVFEARDEDDRSRLIQAAQEHLAKSSHVSREASGAMMVMIEWYAREPERAKKLGQQFEAALSKSQDPQAGSHLRKLQGTVRRLTLLGQPVNIHGTDVDGKAFDFAKMRGKVVLVDFWATWCGPCLAEVPNLKRNYKQYHQRGFEIIGISMDEDRAALDEHLKKDPYPWVTLNNPIADEQHVARYYGITSLPTCILIDRDGKAVSTHAQGPALNKKLEELFGPAEKPRN